ncbi:hypothetical protein C1H46_029505 [Malus baccata]|uniref:Uncharacterized protein n=1 Tax=Malus baccata TaxID=106549 RepID=A0A540LF86_MALBA|nr:hypothetical protein C1H46_029505 [Malus baccata]
MSLKNRIIPGVDAKHIRNRFDPSQGCKRKICRETGGTVVVHPITPTKEEKMAPYWNVIFDDVEAGTDATSEDKSKGVADADYDSEATPSSGPKWKAKKGYHTHLGALPSSPHDNGSSVEDSYRGIRGGATCLHEVGSGWDTYNVPKDEKVDSSPEHPPGYKDLTATSLQPETFAGEGKSDRGKDIAPTTKLPTFDVDLLEIIEAENANNVAQSLLRILQFRVVGELGEEQVSTLERKTRTQRSDCGPFLLKFADYISSGLDIDHVQPQNMPFLG